MNTRIRIQFARMKFISSLSLIWHRFIAVKNSGLLVLVYICLSIDARAQTVIEKTLCNSNGKYVVFAHRPLKRLPFISQPRPADSFSDRNNVQLAHEHIFFCNNGRIERNVGFGLDGRFSEESISDKYRLVNDQKYNPSIINSILGPDACYKSEVGTYGLRSNNCQDFAARVRSEYNRKMSAFAPNTQEGRLSCQATVNKVLAAMRSAGAKNTSYSVSRKSANEHYSGNPTDRSDQIVFTLKDSSSQGYQPIAQSLMGSPKMQAQANNIAKNCGNTAIITFGVYGTDNIHAYFVGASGAATPQRCAAWDRSKVLTPWGEGICE
ncbi:MAG: hypothetical protein ACK6AD_16360 [Cyanobacteriota bacterium]|jgi:hypothetical protein